VVIKVLAVAGTVALILVSGGIFVHHTGLLRYLVPDLPVILQELAAGLAAGLISMGFMALGRKLFKSG
jgi:hypothetical protein